MISPEFEALYNVLMLAYNRAAEGKGMERHGSPGQKFEDQPIFTITRALDVGENLPSPFLWQAVKKIFEAKRLPSKTARHNELLDAIVYLAAAIIYAGGVDKAE